MRSKHLKALAKSGGWLMLGTMAWRISTMLANYFAAYVLGVEAFGRYAICRSSIDVFSVLASMGLGGAAIKYTAQFRESDPSKAGRVLGSTILISAAFSLAVTVAVILSASWIANSMLEDESLVSTIYCCALLILLTTFAQTLEHSLAGFEAFQAICKVNLWRAALTLIVPIVAAWTFGVNGFVIGQAFVSGLVLPVIWRAISAEARKYKMNLEFSRAAVLQERNSFLTFSVPGMLSMITTSFVGFYARSTLVTQHGLSQMGQFAAANQLRGIVMYVPTVMTRAILPMLSRTSTSDAEFKQTTRINIRTSLAILFPAAIAVFCFGDLLLQILGKEYSGSTKLIPIVALFVFIEGSTAIFRRQLDAVGRRWATFAIAIVYTISLVSCCQSLIPSWGAEGLAYSFLFSSLVSLLLTVIYEELVSKNRALDGNVWLVAAIICALGCVLVSFYSGTTAVTRILGVVVPASFAAYFLKKIMQQRRLKQNVAQRA